MTNSAERDRLDECRQTKHYEFSPFMSKALNVKLREALYPVILCGNPCSVKTVTFITEPVDLHYLIEAFC